ncbi:MAG: hypothetical protein AAFV93_07280, partial [Chloroflexota bacterium]
SSAVLSIGAYDIAELLAKRPFDDVTYATTLILRGHLVLFTWLIAIGTQRPLFSASWWWHLIAGLVLVVAQLPPLTFINDLSDSNQQQQALLAMVSLLGVAIGLTGYVWRYRHGLRVIIAIGGVIMTIYGTTNALAILSDYSLPANIGLGAIGLGGLYIVLGIVSLYQLAKSR